MLHTCWLGTPRYPHPQAGDPCSAPAAGLEQAVAQCSRSRRQGAFQLAARVSACVCTARELMHASHPTAVPTPVTCCGSARGGRGSRSGSKLRLLLSPSRATAHTTLCRTAGGIHTEGGLVCEGNTPTRHGTGSVPRAGAGLALGAHTHKQVKPRYFPWLCQPEQLV